MLLFGFIVCYNKKKSVTFTSERQIIEVRGQEIYVEVNGTVEIKASVEMHSYNYFLKATSACVGELLLLDVAVFFFSFF